MPEGPEALLGARLDRERRSRTRKVSTDGQRECAAPLEVLASDDEAPPLPQSEELLARRHIDPVSVAGDDIEERRRLHHADLASMCAVGGEEAQVVRAIARRRLRHLASDYGGLD